MLPNQIDRERTAPKTPVENGTVRVHGDPASAAGAQEYGMLSRSNCDASRSGSWDDQMNLIVLVGCECWKKREKKKHKQNYHHPCIGNPDRSGSFSVWYNSVHIPWLWRRPWSVSRADLAHPTIQCLAVGIPASSTDSWQPPWSVSSPVPGLARKNAHWWWRWAGRER